MAKKGNNKKQEHSNAYRGALGKINTNLKNIKDIENKTMSTEDKNKQINDWINSNNIALKNFVSQIKTNKKMQNVDKVEELKSLRSYLEKNAEGKFDSSILDGAINDLANQEKTTEEEKEENQEQKAEEQNDEKNEQEQSKEEKTNGTSDPDKSEPETKEVTEEEKLSQEYISERFQQVQKEMNELRGTIFNLDKDKRSLETQKNEIDSILNIKKEIDDLKKLPSKGTIIKGIGASGPKGDPAFDIYRLDKELNEKLKTYGKNKTNEELQEESNKLNDELKVKSDSLTNKMQTLNNLQEESVLLNNIKESRENIKNLENSLKSYGDNEKNDTQQLIEEEKDKLKNLENEYKQKFGEKEKSKENKEQTTEGKTNTQQQQPNTQQSQSQQQQNTQQPQSQQQPNTQQPQPKQPNTQQPQQQNKKSLFETSKDFFKSDRDLAIARNKQKWQETKKVRKAVAIAGTAVAIGATAAVVVPAGLTTAVAAGAGALAVQTVGLAAKKVKEFGSKAIPNILQFNRNTSDKLKGILEAKTLSNNDKTKAINEQMNSLEDERGQ